MKRIKSAAAVLAILFVFPMIVSAAEYKHTPDAAISGHNTKHLKNATAQDCMRACDTEPWCKSFDYYKGGMACDLSDKNAADVGGLKTDYSGNPYDHYAKIDGSGSSLVSFSYETIHYRHIPNAAISGHNTKHLTNATVQDCMEACDNNSWCKSFDYYKSVQACDLSDKKASEAGGLKTDYSGNPYDHYEKHKAPAQIQESLRYKHFRNAAISGHNIKHLSNAPVQDCMEACDNASWCRSFDYYKNDRACDLSDKNASDVGGLKTDYSGNPYDHYEKRRP